MSDVNDGLVEAVRLAEKVVECEAKVYKLRNLNAPAGVIDSALGGLGGYMERWMHNSAAEGLLAQARVVVNARAERRRYILEKTLLGKCVAAVDDLNTVFAHTPSSMDDDASWPPADQEMIEILTQAISAGDSHKIACALALMLDEVVYDLEQRSEDLPE